MRRFSVLAVIALACSQLFAQYETSVQNASNYNPTGSQAWTTNWDSVVVMKNNLITVATVPKIGGRTMEYSLGGHNGMLVSPSYLGQLPTADQAMGGFLTLPSPQSDFSWPPPPSFCVNPFTPTIVANSADSCSLLLQQAAPDNSTNAKLKGLSFKRTLTIYKNSTKVHVAMVLTNLGTSTTLPQKGIWDITENSCYNAALVNDTMCWAYVPLNPNSTLKSPKHYNHLGYAGGSTDTTEEYPNVGGLTNILGIKYKGTKSSLVGADDVAGWIGFVDKRNGYAFVKRFTYVPGANYPDTVSISVYTNPSTTASSAPSNSYFEVEVKGPMKQLQPNDSLNFSMDLYAARCWGHIAWVNEAGLVSRHLGAAVTGDSVALTGSFGVFYPGYTKSIFLNASGTVLSSLDSTAISPLDSLVLNKKIKAPANAAKMYLALYKANGTLIGNLDTVQLTAVSTSPSPAFKKLLNGDTHLAVRGNGALEIHAGITGAYSVELARVDGKRLASFKGMKPQTFVYGTAGVPAGIYLVKTAGANGSSVQKIFLGR